MDSSSVLGTCKYYNHVKIKAYIEAAYPLLLNTATVFIHQMSRYRDAACLWLRS